MPVVEVTVDDDFAFIEVPTSGGWGRRPCVVIPEALWQAVGDVHGDGGALAVLRAEFDVNAVQLEAWALQETSAGVRQLPAQLEGVADALKAVLSPCRLLGVDYLMVVLPS